MWSPAEHKPIMVAKIADIPLDVATHASAASRAARRSWNMVTVGFVNRE